MNNKFKYPASILASVAVLAGGVGTSAASPRLTTDVAIKAAPAQPSWPSFPAFTKDVTITWWTFDDNVKNVVAAFNKVYPNIHVLTPLVGAGQAEYTKLQTVIKAGTGAPDLVQIEYPILPEFIATGGLADISKYVGSYAKYFSPAVWDSGQELRQGLRGTGERRPPGFHVPARHLQEVRAHAAHHLYAAGDRRGQASCG